MVKLTSIFVQFLCPIKASQLSLYSLDAQSEKWIIYSCGTLCWSAPISKNILFFGSFPTIFVNINWSKKTGETFSFCRVKQGDEYRHVNILAKPSLASELIPRVWNELGQQHWVGTLSLIFSLSKHLYNLQQKCEKLTISIWRLDSNSSPLEHKSPRITTRPGLSPY